MNTWPNGVKHAMTQKEHKAWNANNYPGTLEICSVCENPTGRCEEDNITNENGEPHCHSCAETAGMFETD